MKYKIMKAKTLKEKKKKKTCMHLLYKSDPNNSFQGSIWDNQIKILSGDWVTAFVNLFKWEVPLNTFTTKAQK